MMLVGRGGEARKHEAGVAAGSMSRNARGLDENDRPAAARDFARRRQPGEPAADDANFDVEVDVELRPFRRFHLGRRIPGVAVS